MQAIDSLLVGEVPAYAALQRQMHDALREQHPEWIWTNGDSPICDGYDSRFAEILRLLAQPQVTKSA